MKATYHMPTAQPEAWIDPIPRLTFRQLNGFYSSYLNTDIAAANTTMQSRYGSERGGFSLVLPEAISIQTERVEFDKTDKRRQLEEILAQLDAEFDADREAGLLSPELLQTALVQVRAKRPYR